MLTDVETPPTSAATVADGTSRAAKREEPGALQSARNFAARHFLRLAAISSALLIPCFWHRYIAAGDLDSHLYNTWLVQLIYRGRAPGLYIARQWHNVLFDYILGGLGNLFGLHAAERIGVSLAVLIFFWGAFSLVAAVTNRAPWCLTPLLAMLAFGWTFEMGFFNFYLSLGLAFFTLAIFWRGRGWERWAVLALAPLAWMAHPLGFGFLAGAAAYLALARAISGKKQILLLAAAAGILAAAARFLAIYFPGPWAPVPGVKMMGPNQLALIEPKYWWAAGLTAATALAVLVVDIMPRRRDLHFWREYGLPLQLYVAAILGVSLLPGAVHVPQFGAPVELLTERFSLIAAILGCCLLGVARPRRWHLIGFGAVALIYFSLLYGDTRTLVQMEAQAEQLVATLPPGSRVTSAIWTTSDLPLLSNHIADRACIGHCFSFGNYEPGSGQFRVRAMPGNQIVAPDVKTSMAMQTGTYIVRAQDLPLYQIYQCTRNAPKLCLRELTLGGSSIAQPPPLAR